MKKIIDRNNENFEELLDKVTQHLMNNNGVNIDNIDAFKKSVAKLILNEDQSIEIIAAGD